MNFINPGLVLLYPTKCYTTSLKAFFAGASAIDLHDAEKGKHIVLANALNVVDNCLGYVPLDLHVAVPIRRPAMRLLSIYRSHMKDAFDGLEISSKGLAIDEYFSKRFDVLGYDRIEYTEYVDSARYDYTYLPVDEPALFRLAIESLIERYALPLEFDWMEHLNPSPDIDLPDETLLNELVLRHYPRSASMYEKLRHNGFVAPKPYRR